MNLFGAVKLQQNLAYLASCQDFPTAMLLLSSCPSLLRPATLELDSCCRVGSQPCVCLCRLQFKF